MADAQSFASLLAKGYEKATSDLGKKDKKVEPEPEAEKSADSCPHCGKTINEKIGKPF